MCLERAHIDVNSASTNVLHGDERERCSQREEAFYIQSIHSVAKADEMTEQTLLF